MARTSPTVTSAQWEPGDPFTMITKEEGELCCPHLWKLPCGDLLVSYSDDGDFQFAQGKVLRSRDGGQTWAPESEPVARILNHIGCIAEVGGGITRAYDSTTFAVKGSSPKRFLYQYRDSTDGGRSFGPARYGSYENEGESAPRVSELEKYLTLFDRLITWGEVLEAAGWEKKEWTEVEVGPHGPSYHSNLLKGADGSLLNVINTQWDGEKRTPNYHLHMSRSTDGGVNWRYHSRITPIEHPAGVRSNPSEGYATRLADGRIYVVYRYPPNDRQVQHLWSTDDGRSWTIPRSIDPRVCGIVPAAKPLRDGGLFLVHGRPGMFLTFDPTGTGEGWEIDSRIDLTRGEDLTIRTNAKVVTARLDLLTYSRYARPAYTWARQDLFSGYYYSWENINGLEVFPGRILLVYDLQNWIERPGAPPRKAVRGVWVTKRP